MYSVRQQRRSGLAVIVEQFFADMTANCVDREAVIHKTAMAAGLPIECFRWLWIVREASRSRR